MDYNNYSNENSDVEKSGFRKVFLIGALSILVMAIVVSVIVAISIGVKESKYNSAIVAGNAYYTSGDYENAIIQYRLAISINAEKSAAYVNLASAYCGIGDYNSALYVLQYGLNATRDANIQDRLAKVETMANFTLQEEQVHQLSESEINRISNNTLLENTYFDMVSSYTYSEYFRDYGEPTERNTNAGKLTLTYGSVGFQTIYYDLNDEKVLDNTGNKPLAAAKPCKVSFNSLDRLFSCKDSYFVISFNRLKELLGGNIELKHDDATGRYYVQANYKNCKISVQTDNEGRLVSINAWNEIEPLNRGESVTEGEVDGSVSGYIQDATTGRNMRATIKVRNRGVRNGSALYETTTGTDGGYKFEGKTGSYTMEVTAIGYNSEFLDFDIIFGQSQIGKNIVLAPTSQNGELRIVLTWGNYPTDLDSHAEGRSSNGSNFHIYFSQRNANNVGDLDVDDTNGYGPETITITDAGSNFKYYVHDFTNSGNMNSSGAIVKVYLPDGTNRVFNVPTTGSGDYWNVFEYNNGQITVINTRH